MRLRGRRHYAVYYRSIEGSGDAFVDTPDEVDAVFRSQRRAAFGHFILFGLFLGGGLTAVLVLPWWTDSSAIGGLSPGFVLVGGGIYLIFVAIAVSAATLANGIEDSMMGPPLDSTDPEE